MQRRLTSIVFAVVLFLSFAVGAGQASANPGNGQGAQTTTTTDPFTSYGITWE